TGLGAGLRERPPRRTRRERRHQLRSRDRRDRARADEPEGGAGACRRGDRVSAAAAPRMAAAGRRAHLLETAARVFVEGSYRGTTTAEIARAAGISEPIIYRHFASKRDLYLATLEYVWEKARAGWEQTIANSSDACAAVEAIGKGQHSVRSAKLQLAELWVQALREASEDAELRKHLRSHMREVHDFVAALIRNGQ